MRTDAQGREQLAKSGYRSTPQRRVVYRLLQQNVDHPTANEVFLRARQALPGISMATVYNCLEALVQCGLIRQVNLDRTASRYCANMDEHCHFCCECCGSLFDVHCASDAVRRQAQLPPGFQATRYELVIRGICATCAAERRPQREQRPEKAGAPVV
ncbi:MAG: transcriptional repressor [Candidatus Omnitrophica bacterium]|nr:transcriptional repressor [Candidatus Omnitrophota bacterium]